MPNELMKSDEVWSKEKRDVIRKTFAPQLNPTEFSMFVGLGKSLGANPFTREIWAVKYGNQEAQIFLGRDFYRRKAQEQSEYNGHQVDAVYEGDEFKMVNGKPEHSYSLKDRGALLGAYCIVYSEGREPYFVFADYAEYTTGKSTWKDKPATMIKKVAEAQALRGAFQGVFAGTYDQSEEWEDAKEIEENPSQYAPLPPEVEKLRDRYPFDNTLKCPRDSHKPYLNDGSEELNKVEQDVRDAILIPRYVRYFYTVTNSVWDYLQGIPEEMKQLDEAVESNR